MSFRLRIFMLVMLVAATAIGATAWLTLSLTSKEVSRTQLAQARHETEIIDAITGYGLRHGSWPGIDRVVTALSQRTDLHIRLRTSDGQVLADSDTLQGRAAGPVQASALNIDPRPPLDPSIGRLADNFRAYTPTSKLYLKTIYGPTPSGPVFGSAPALAARQAAQYRAALLSVRCVSRRTGSDPALLTDNAPYLTPVQINTNIGCVKQATQKVLADNDWRTHINTSLAACTKITAKSYSTMSRCVGVSFSEAVATTAAVPLQLYLGTGTESDMGDLGRPAIYGAAGLLVVAMLGTALIARRVSRPVRQLTQASRQLADGRLDVRVPARGHGELARLSASFNAMAEAVQRSEERQRRLVADVAHEMRTPLSNLRGYLEGLSDGVVEPSRDLFASLHEETMLQRRILDDLQVLALAEAGNLSYAKTLTNLSSLAAIGATAHRAVAAEAGVAVTVDVPAPVWVNGDSDRLRQVLGNLLTNAIRYTDNGGHVLIRVRAEGGDAVLAVHDTGVGIASVDLPRVFDRFWRADPARQRATGGTGLGLTIAHRIITDHGGRIEITSSPHKGTTFTVRLQLSAETPTAAGT